MAELSAAALTSRARSAHGRRCHGAPSNSFPSFPHGIAAPVLLSRPHCNGCPHALLCPCTYAVCGVALSCPSIACTVHPSWAHVAVSLPDFVSYLCTVFAGPGCVLQSIPAKLTPALSYCPSPPASRRFVPVPPFHDVTCPQAAGWPPAAAAGTCDCRAGLRCFRGPPPVSFIDRVSHKAAHASQPLWQGAPSRPFVESLRPLPSLQDVRPAPPNCCCSGKAQPPGAQLI
jgi:hypothetical protein